MLKNLHTPAVYCFRSRSGLKILKKRKATCFLQCALYSRLPKQAHLVAPPVSPHFVPTPREQGDLSLSNGLRQVL